LAACAEATTAVVVSAGAAGVAKSVREFAVVEAKDDRAGPPAAVRPFLVTGGARAGVFSELGSDATGVVATTALLEEISARRVDGVRKGAAGVSKKKNHFKLFYVTCFTTASVP